MKLKQFIAFGASLLISLSSLFVLAPSVAHAAIKTWVGGGTNTGGVYSMSAADNWTGGAPIAGDDLVFPNGGAYTAINNDFPASTSFNSISFTGTGLDYIIVGNAIDLVAGVTCSNGQSGFLEMDIAITASQTFQTGTTCFLGIGKSDGSNTLSLGSNTLTTSTPGGMFINSVIGGTGGLTLSGNSFVRLTFANTYSGATTIQTGSALYIDNSNSLGTTGGTTTVQDGATLALSKTSGDMDVTEPITIAGSGVVSTGDYTGYFGSLAYGSSGAGPTASNRTLTLSGSLTLTGDVSFALLGTNNTMSITGAISGNYYIDLLKGGSKTDKLVISSSSNGSKTANGTYYSDKLTVTVSDSQPATTVTVSDNTEYIINGTRGATTVLSGGVLKGTGTVGVLDVNGGGKVAPGQSPGCLNAGNTSFVVGSSFDVELGGTTACSEYDQLNVTGTVNVGSATLNVSLYNNFKPAKGNSFVIVKNDGADAVTGVFNNLAEGSSVGINGYMFTISYIGGDGNDVVLTLLSAPAAPSTGFQTLTQNPLSILFVTTTMAGAILLLSRKYNLLRG